MAQWCLNDENTRKWFHIILHFLSHSWTTNICPDTLHDTTLMGQGKRVSTSVAINVRVYSWHLLELRNLLGWVVDSVTITKQVQQNVTKAGYTIVEFCANIFALRMFFWFSNCFWGQSGIHFLPQWQQILKHQDGIFLANERNSNSAYGFSLVKSNHSKIAC